MIRLRQSSEQMMELRPQGVNQKHGEGNQAGQTNQKGLNLVHGLLLKSKANPET